MVDVYNSPPGQGVERDLASEDARRFTQIESMSLTLHSFKSSKPLKDILWEELWEREHVFFLSEESLGEWR